MIGVLLAVTLPLQCAVPQAGDKPAVDRKWLEERVAEANAIFAPQGIQFALQPTRDLPARHAVMEDRRDRTALTSQLQPKVINCFVVNALWDIHEKGRLRQGVHWRPRGKHGSKHYVIIAAYSGPTVLAHELGHFFGNRKHSPTPGNIMSYSRGEGLPVFDAKQARVIARFLRRFIKTKELVPLKEATHASPGAAQDRPAPDAGRPPDP